MRHTRSFVAAALFVGSAVTSVVSLGASAPVAAVAVVPAGFTASDLAQFDSPTAVEWLPSGSLAVLEQDGQLLLSQPTGWSFTTALDLDVCSSSERGLLGLAPDPGFLGNGFVYLYYTRSAPGSPGNCVNRVSRFTLLDRSIDPATEVVIIDNISSNNGNHNGGDLEFGPDGFLYVAVGDAGRDPRGNSGSAGNNDAAQDLSLLNGKVLRITTAGQPAPGNPFTGAGTVACGSRGNTSATPTTTCQEVWAYGLRNPYRFAFDQEAGQFFINDVGQGTYEEVNIGQAGGNYGWPLREGACPQGDTTPCPGPTNGLIDPVTAYGRNLGTYITAGAAVPNATWPTAYDGAYLFADGGTGRIWARQQTGAVDYQQPFASQVQGITDMVFGFDGIGRSVLYTVSAGGTLGMIGPSAPLQTVPNASLAYEALPPFRAFDTGDGTGGAPVGKVAAGTTVAVDAGLPANATAAMINITMAESAGPGWLRLWAPGTPRPTTSTVNVDSPTGGAVANAAIVPLDSQGRFLVEASAATRIVVDVMGVFRSAPGPVSGGRFQAIEPTRLVDTRLPAGGSQPTAENQYSIASDGTVSVGSFSRPGAIPGVDASAVVLSVVAIGTANTPGGYASAYPGAGQYAGTSNVNVAPGDVRANTIVVPFDESGRVNILTLNLDDVVVDLLGYFTSPSSAASTSGTFSFVEPTRVVDTRIPQGFPRFTADSERTISTDFTSDGTLVQNVTATGTGAPGWVAVFPGGSTYDGTSTVNFTGSSQTRAVVTFAKVGTGGSVSYRSLVDTDLVVDAVGIFSE